MTGYETVIGLEIHIELSTKSKIFCGCSTEFGAESNTLVCPVCLGLPGTLPVPNRKVIEYAVSVGSALNCEVKKRCRFDRKNYFYPDNPQNYQISQLYFPICENGYIELDGKKIRIKELHMEEDAGKLIHREDGTYIDYNRAGVPLIEIVTEPDLKNVDEVIGVLKKLKSTIEYLGASDCRMNEGSMRVDLNLSVRGVGEKTLGTRTEMKNLNSFKSIAKAIDVEGKRQIKLLEEGKKVEQQTRGWDDEKQTSFVLRSKEDSSDYRYFPEPDIPDIVISEDLIKNVIKERPELKEDRIKRYTKEHGLSIEDADIITDHKNISDIYDETVGIGADPKQTANWLMGETLKLSGRFSIDLGDVRLDVRGLRDIIELNTNGNINSTVAKEVFLKLYEHCNTSSKKDADFDVNEYIEKNNLKQVSGEEDLLRVVESIIKENPKAVEDFNAGKEKVLGFLVGEAMKKMGGRCDPKGLREVFRKALTDAGSS